MLLNACSMITSRPTRSVRPVLANTGISRFRSATPSCSCPNCDIPPMVSWICTLPSPTAICDWTAPCTVTCAPGAGRTPSPRKLLNFPAPHAPGRLAPGLPLCDLCRSFDRSVDGRVRGYLQDSGEDQWKVAREPVADLGQDGGLRGVGFRGPV